MSLTSYRAAPPRVKPLRCLRKTGPEVNRPTRVRRRSIPSGGFLRRQPGQSHRVRGVCINVPLLWKGARPPFCRFYDSKNEGLERQTRPLERLLQETPQKRSFAPQGAAKQASRTKNGGMHVTDTFDFVVVGGGSGGCTVAGRLSEDPNISVAVVDAGGKNDNWVVT